MVNREIGTDTIGLAPEQITVIYHLRFTIYQK